MLNLDEEGMVIGSPRIMAQRRSAIERSKLDAVHGIIVHQTGADSAKSALNSYLQPKANGAHFLIDKDGSIYQTASLYKQTWHVGKLQARCLAESRCSPVEIEELKKFNPRAENEREQEKDVPDRYPSNVDSIGIELVGGTHQDKDAKTKIKPEVYDTVTAPQNEALTWLMKELQDTLQVPSTEIFRHPVVSRKNPTEASTATW